MNRSYRRGIGVVRYYVLCALTLATLMYSTSLHLFVGAESTLSSRYLTKELETSPENEWLKKHNFVTEDAGAVGKVLSQQGIPAAYDMLIRPRQRHKLARFKDDIVRYIIQTNEPDEAQAPFKYRFLPTTIVRNLRLLTGRGVYVPVLFVWFNFACVLAAALWFVHFLHAQLRFARSWALLGGVMLVTLVQVTATLPFVMLEPASVLAALPLFVFAQAGRPRAFMISAVLAVMVKEVFVFWGLVWALAQVDLSVRRASTWFRTAALVLAPVLTFMTIRKWMGGAALEVNRGFDLASGELPSYLGHRLRSLSNFKEFATSLALGFGALWLGVVGAVRDDFLRRVVWIVPVLVGAALTFSGYVGRVVGLLYPVLIPGFLILLRDAAEHGETEPS